ncbi:MAG TPA: glycerophosphodiester phosphodiesterase family protein [Myxococcaceae bacterium]|nr:glycerophosphodiester phosphodiesterase family protein [Myxococcaceae bacterium]
MLILAHRGASADAPENTLDAFRLAVEQGADGVELDAMVCGSGEVVVCHDQRLKRLAGLDWEVERTPLWKLRQVDVGTALGFAPARIPTLAEVVDALPPNFLINIELKNDQLDDRGLSHQVATFVRNACLEKRILISSFSPWCLWRVAEIEPRLRRGFLIDPDRCYLAQAHLLARLVAQHSVHLPDQACTAGRVSQWLESGREVAAWTVDLPDRALELQQMGVLYCITNRPSVLRAAVLSEVLG